MGKLKKQNFLDSINKRAIFTLGKYYNRVASKFFFLIYVNDLSENLSSILKACVRYFHQIFIFSPNDSLQKLWKMLFISLKSSFRSRDIHFLLYFCPFLYFCIFVFVFVFTGWSKIILKVHDVMNSLNKSSITHFVWYHEKEKVWHWNLVHRWSIR